MATPTDGNVNLYQLWTARAAECRAIASDMRVWDVWDPAAVHLMESIAGGYEGRAAQALREAVVNLPHEDVTP